MTAFHRRRSEKHHCILFNNQSQRSATYNKPGTAKVGENSKAQNCKYGDPLGFVKLQLVAKYEKNWRGTLGRFLKKFRKKLLKWDFLSQCHSAEKCKLVESKKLQKSRIVPKKIRVKNTKGILCYRGSGRRCFCCGRGSGVSSMLWTSVVQVDDVEQMNKKADRSLWTDKKTSHCKSREFLRKRRLTIGKTKNLSCSSSVQNFNRCNLVA